METAAYASWWGHERRIFETTKEKPWYPSGIHLQRSFYENAIPSSYDLLSSQDIKEDGSIY